MADSFFGFDSDMPTHRAGKKADGMEDEIDLMNDETFGDGALLGEDWEEQHEKMAGQLRNLASSHIDYPHGCSDHMIADHMTYRNGADSRGESPENELEQSINQLVVDDEEDPSIAQCTRGRPIPGRKLPVDLENLFGPGSPPGLFEAENLVAGQHNIWGSPTTHDSFVRKQEEGLKMLLKQMQTRGGNLQMPEAHHLEHNGQMLSNSLPEAYTLAEIEGRVGPSTKTFTLEELEKQLTGGPHTITEGALNNIQSRVRSPVQSGFPLPIGTPPQGNFMQAKGSYGVHSTGQIRISPTQIMQVGHQQQQQQLLKLLASNLSSPQVVSPVVQPLRVTSPTVPSPPPQNTELRMVQALVGESPPNPSVKLTPMARNILQGFLEKQASSGGRVSPGLGKSPSDTSGHVKPLMSAMSTPPQQRIPSHSSSTDPLHIRGRGSYHQGQHRGHPKQNLFQQDRDYRERTRHDSHGSYHSRGGRGYYQNGERGGYRQDGDWDRGGYYNRGDRDRGYDRNYHQNGGGDWDYRKKSPGQNYQNNRSRYPGPYGDSEGEEDEDPHNRDEYAGLMSKREKDWIIKIQLMQLQTDNPYLDDFYFTLWQLKKIAKERLELLKAAAEGTDAEPSLVLPQLSGRVEFKPYKPVQFENSLGRLTAASVHNPRQIIDVRRDSTHKDDAKGREVRRFRQLLLDIEQAYDLLLVIDDLEKRAMALPEDQRPNVLESRRQAIHSMFLGLRADCEETDFFRRIINVRKGIKLIARLLPILDKSEGVLMTCALLRYVGDVVSKKGWQKEVLPCVNDTIKIMVASANLESIALYAEAFQSSKCTLTISTALQNQFGANVIWCLMKRGETIYNKESPLDLDVEDQKNWVEFIEQVAECLSSIQGKDLPQIPTKAVRAVQEHFKRLLGRSLYLSIEDTLQLLSTEQEPKS